MNIVDEVGKPEEGAGFIFRRGPAMVPEVNIPVLVTHHSPDHFEWGYSGSGPADLALNMVEYTLRRVGFNGPVHEHWANDGSTIFQATAELYQDFKSMWVLHIPAGGMVMEFDLVDDWLFTHMLDRGLAIRGEHNGIPSHL